MNMAKGLLFLLGMPTLVAVATTTMSVLQTSPTYPTTAMSSTSAASTATTDGSSAQQTTSPNSTSGVDTGASSNTMTPSSGSSSGQGSNGTGGQTSTSSPGSSSTSEPDLCYNYTCTATGCLKDAIDSDRVTICPRNDKYCKITKTTKDGQHKIVANCVSDNCEFSQSNSKQQGEITQNCCDTSHCNTEELLKGAATQLLPPPLFLSFVALVALMIPSA